MTVETLIAALEGVRQTGPDRWKARCPGHPDRSPSLSIRALSDGRVLVHCFANCTTQEVLDGAGLQLDALFPERLRHHSYGPARKPFNAADTLKAVAFEALTIRMIALAMQRGEIGDGSMERLKQAVGRILAAEDLINAS